MRSLNISVLTSAAVAQTDNGTVLNTDQVMFLSAQCTITGTPTGTFKLQASNDPVLKGFPINWSDIPNATASVAAAGTFLIPKFDIAYQWVRAVYTDTGAGSQTVAPIADTGVKQHQTVTTIDDVSGSLNSTYFLLSSVNLITKAQKNFYLWLDDGAGVDPAIAGRTGIQVTYTDNDAAATIATAIRAALNALTNDFVATGATSAVIITNVAFGPVPAAVDGAAPTGFTFGSATLGVASNLNNTFFKLEDEGSTHKYIVWMNVDSIGTAPVLAGYTAVPIAFSSGETAANIGSDIATAVGALNSSNSFTASGTTTVTIVNKVAGPFVPMSDGSAPTHFTFAVTAGAGIITANIKTLGE